MRSPDGSEIAVLLRENSRENEVVGRYGGEEFCILMPRTTAAAAQVKLDQLLKAWRATRFDLGSGVLTGASFSVGIADSITTPGSVWKLPAFALAAWSQS